LTPKSVSADAAPRQRGFTDKPAVVTATRDPGSSHHLFIEYGEMRLDRSGIVTFVPKSTSLLRGIKR